MPSCLHLSSVPVPVTCKWLRTMAGERSPPSPPNRQPAGLVSKVPEVLAWSGSPLSPQNVCLLTSQPTWKIPQFSCEKINPKFSGFQGLVLPTPLPSTFYTGLNFPCYIQELCPVHEHTTGVINIKNKFFFCFFFPHCPVVIRVSETRQVNNSAWINSVLWAPRGQGALGWVALALLRQKKCFCACWRLGEGSWPGHSASILASATEARQRWAPTREAQAGGAWVLGGRAAAAVFGFPLVPGI